MATKYTIMIVHEDGHQAQIWFKTENYCKTPFIHEGSIFVKICKVMETHQMGSHAKISCENKHLSIMKLQCFAKI